MKNPKYNKQIKPGVTVDVYDVLQAWNVTNPALQHMIKKALQCGQRGHKDTAEDMADIVACALRAQEIELELQACAHENPCAEIDMSQPLPTQFHYTDEEIKRAYRSFGIELR
jgi:hypothetical protein